MSTPICGKKTTARARSCSRHGESSREESPMSDPYRITLPTAMKDRLRTKATELGTDPQRLVEHTLEMLLGGEVKPLTAARRVTVEDAGEILLAHIEPSQAALILDICRGNGRKPYEYLR